MRIYQLRNFTPQNKRARLAESALRLLYGAKLTREQNERRLRKPRWREQVESFELRCQIIFAVCAFVFAWCKLIALPWIEQNATWLIQ